MDFKVIGGSTVHYNNKKYKKIHKIGSGDEGKVYLLKNKDEDEDEDEEYLVVKAIKLLSDKPIDIQVESIKNEAAWYKTLYDEGEYAVDEKGEFAYILMPYFRGETFYKFVFNSAVSYLDCGLAIISELILLHALRQMVHRDGNGNNIIVDYDEKLNAWFVYFIDFEYTKKIGHVGALSYRKAGRKGAPESQDAKCNVQPTEDVYLLGASFNGNNKKNDRLFQNFPHIRIQLNKFILEKMTHIDPAKRPSLQEAKFLWTQWREFCRYGVDQPGDAFVFSSHVMNFAAREIFASIPKDKLVDYKVSDAVMNKKPLFADPDKESDAKGLSTTNIETLLTKCGAALQRTIKTNKKSKTQSPFEMNPTTEDFFEVSNYLKVLAIKFNLTREQCLEAWILMCRYNRVSGDVLDSLNVNFILLISMLIVTARVPSAFTQEVARIESNLIIRGGFVSIFHRKLGDKGVYVDHEEASAFLKEIETDKPGAKLIA